MEKKIIRRVLLKTNNREMLLKAPERVLLLTINMDSVLFAMLTLLAQKEIETETDVGEKNKKHNITSKKTYLIPHLFTLHMAESSQVKSEPAMH